MVVVFFTYRSLPDADKFYEAFGWEMGWIARALASGHGYSSPYTPGPGRRRCSRRSIPLLSR